MYCIHQPLHIFVYLAQHLLCPVFWHIFRGGNLVVTRHQKEILYKKIYNEKVKELKKDTVIAVILSVCHLALSLCLIVRVLQRDDLLCILCFVVFILCFFLCVFKVVYYQKIIPNEFAEYINTGLCNVSQKQDCDGQRYFCIDMGVYCQKIIPLENIGEYIEEFKTEKVENK